MLQYFRSIRKSAEGDRSMHRFFAARIDENRAELPIEEEAHALRVLRMNAGDECQALIEGSIYSAVIEETAPRVILRLGDMLPSPEPGVKITLYHLPIVQFALKATSSPVVKSTIL